MSAAIDHHTTPARTWSVALIALLAGGPDGIPRYASALVRAIDAVAPEFPSLDLAVVAHAPALAALELRNLRATGPGWLDRVSATAGPRRISRSSWRAA